MDIRPIFTFGVGRKERRKQIRAARRQFIPLEGSLRWAFRKREGQKWRYYIKNMFWRARYTCRTTRDRIVWGSAISDYMDLDSAILHNLRNGIISLKLLNHSYPGCCVDEHEWEKELDKALTLLNAYLDDEDKTAYLAFMDWLKVYLPHLWD